MPSSSASRRIFFSATISPVAYSRRSYHAVGQRNKPYQSPCRPRRKCLRAHLILKAAASIDLLLSYLFFDIAPSRSKPLREGPCVAPLPIWRKRGVRVQNDNSSTCVRNEVTPGERGGGEPHPGVGSSSTDRASSATAADDGGAYFRKHLRVHPPRVQRVVRRAQWVTGH